jgi:hypothetical protein
MPPEKK